MDFASLLLIMTLPDGSKKVMAAFPTPAAECQTVTGSYPEKAYPSGSVRWAHVCVRSPAWVISPRYWRVIGNKVYWRRTMQRTTSPSP